LGVGGWGFGVWKDTLMSFARERTRDWKGVDFEI